MTPLLPSRAGSFITALRAATIIFGTVAAALVPHALPAQTSRAPVGAATRPAVRNDTLAYIYLVGTDTVAVERVVTRADGVRGELIAKSQGRFVWHQHIVGNQPTEFDLDYYAPTAGAGALPLQSVTLRVDGDSGFMAVNANGASNTTVRLKIGTGTEWMLNSSVLHTDVLATLAARRKQDTVGLVLTQGATQLKMAVRKLGDTTLVNLANVDTRFVHDALGLKEA
ncbi:MAG: hypothetical protein ABI120_07635, partial [Gemmatimonadaceae bacterium]